MFVSDKCSVLLTSTLLRRLVLVTVKAKKNCMCLSMWMDNAVSGFVVFHFKFNQEGLDSLSICGPLSFFF